MAETIEAKPLNIDLSSLIPGITDEVTAKLRESAIAGFEWRVKEAVGKEIERFIAENIVPSVQAEVKAHEAEIKASIIAGVIAATTAASKKMAEVMTAQLSGYDGDKVIAEIIRALTPSRY